MKKNLIEGIVVKVTESHCVILCDNGVFKNIPRSKEEVPRLGQRIAYKNKSNNKIFNMKYISLLSMAAILFLAVISYGFNPKSSEAHYIITMDINPSIEIFLNEDLDVIKLFPLNEDGERVVESIEIEDLNLNQLVKEIITRAVSEGYLNQNDTGLINTTIVDLKDNTKLGVDQLKETLEKQLQNQRISAEVHVFKETKEYYDQAQLMDISVNKYRLFQALKDKGMVSKIDEIRGKSLKELETMVVESDNSVSTPVDIKDNPSKPVNPNDQESIQEKPSNLGESRNSNTQNTESNPEDSIVNPKEKENSKQQDEKNPKGDSKNPQKERNSLVEESNETQENTKPSTPSTEENPKEMPEEDLTTEEENQHEDQNQPPEDLEEKDSEIKEPETPGSNEGDETPVHENEPIDQGPDLNNPVEEKQGSSRP